MSTTSLNITEVRVLLLGGTDKVILYTDLSEGCWPYKGKMSFTGEVAHGNGVRWCRENLGVEPEVIEAGVH